MSELRLGWRDVGLRRKSVAKQVPGFASPMLCLSNISDAFRPMRATRC